VLLRNLLVGRYGSASSVFTKGSAQCSNFTSHISRPPRYNNPETGSTSVRIAHPKGRVIEEAVKTKSAPPE
jgi:hypothetical protein